MVLDSLDEDALPGRMAYIDAGPAEIAMAEMVQPRQPVLLPVQRLQGHYFSAVPMVSRSWSFSAMPAAVPFLPCGCFHGLLLWGQACARGTSSPPQRFVQDVAGTSLQDFRLLSSDAFCLSVVSRRPRLSWSCWLQQRHSSGDILSSRLEVMGADGAVLDDWVGSISLQHPAFRIIAAVVMNGFGLNASSRVGLE